MITALIIILVLGLIIIGWVSTLPEPEEPVFPEKRKKLPMLDYILPSIHLIECPTARANSPP